MSKELIDYNLRFRKIQKMWMTDAAVFKAKKRKCQITSSSSKVDLIKKIGGDTLDFSDFALSSVENPNEQTQGKFFFPSTTLGKF